MTKTVWTLRDAMRLSHPKGVDRSVGNFILRGEVAEDSPAIIQGFKEVQGAKTEKEVLSVLERYPNLPWEALPTEFHKNKKVWTTLFYNGALNGQALVRNVTRLARMEAFNDMKFAADYAAKLSDPEQVRRGRVHPMNYLNALMVYTEGQIERNSYSWWASSRKKDWRTAGAISQALEKAFYESFKHVEPANKRTLLALDVSGSMSAAASGLDLSCAQVGAAMAMTIARTEPYSDIMGFSTSFRDLGINKSTSLATAIKKTEGQVFGATDCAQPMLWALENRVEVDTFVVITDNETWYGHIKPFQALDKYNSQMNRQARMAVVGLNSTEFTIAQPGRSDMMDVVGGDSNLPRVLAEFSAGRI